MKLEIKKHDPLIKILIVRGNKELITYKTSYRYLDVFYSLFSNTHNKFYQDEYNTLYEDFDSKVYIFDFNHLEPFSKKLFYRKSTRVLKKELLPFIKLKIDAYKKFHSFLNRPLATKRRCTVSYLDEYSVHFIYWIYEEDLKTFIISLKKNFRLPIEVTYEIYKHALKSHEIQLTKNILINNNILKRIIETSYKNEEFRCINDALALCLKDVQAKRKNI